MSDYTKTTEYYESGIQFTFAKDWVVQKYDQHTYFQGLAGAGLKGIDFIGLLQGKQLLLMEVKNFRSRPGIDANPLASFLDDPGALIDTFEEKVQDTLKAIETIVAYFKRSRWYRVALPFLRRMPISLSNRVFWTHAFEKSNVPEQLILVLWVELDEDQAAFLDQLEPLLLEKLSRLSNHVYLSNTKKTTFNIGLKTELKSL